MNRNLGIGDEVYLAANHNWVHGKDNPLTCVGTVYSQNHYTYVEWENGTDNTYDFSGNDLIPKVQPSRDTARVEARRNPNVTVKREGSQWVLALKNKLVINDGGNK